MKNIHLIPTDKPSRLYTLNSSKKLYYTNNNLNQIKFTVNQNIYITSDEEITGFENYIWVYNNGRVWLWQNTMALRSDNKPRKIILTTDGDLIKNGVQAIDDEFLEWFVKNPSCQYGGYKNIDWDKIITQKEEPKQETLEEASERIYPTTIDSFTDNGFDLSERERLIFINGAEWQAERMYSKEDMEYAFKSSSLTNVLDVYESFEEFIGQYKKK